MTNRAIGVSKGRNKGESDTRGQDIAEKLRKSTDKLTAPVRLLRGAAKAADTVGRKVTGKPEKPTGYKHGGRVAVKPSRGGRKR